MRQEACESLQQARNVRKKHACCTEGIQHGCFCSHAQLHSNKERNVFHTQDSCKKIYFTFFFNKCIFSHNLKQDVSSYRQGIFLFQVKAEPRFFYQSETVTEGVFQFIQGKLIHIPFFPNLTPRQTTPNTSFKTFTDHANPHTML